MENKNIYQRILQVMRSVGYIQKDGEMKTEKFKYKFASHDAVINAVRGPMIDSGIVMVPTVKEWRQNANRTECTMSVSFINADEPDDRVTVESFGYGIDPSDKGPGKAVSYATKYAILKAFALETGDDPDKENINFNADSNGNGGNGHKSPDKTVEEAQAILGGQEETAYTNDAYGRIDKFLAEKTNGSESAVKSKLRSLAKSSGVDPKLLNTIECVGKLNPAQASMIAKHIKDSEDIPF